MLLEIHSSLDFGQNQLRFQYSSTMGKLSLAIVLCVAAIYSSQASTPKVSEAILRQLLVPGSAPQVSLLFIIHFIHLFILIFNRNVKYRTASIIN
jgi:hypothetical protein